jgi:hypothetical protein
MEDESGYTSVSPIRELPFSKAGGGISFTKTVIKRGLST